VLKTGFSQRQQELTAKQKELQIYRKQIGHLAVASNDQSVQPMIQRMSSLNDAWTDAQVERLEFQATEAAVKLGLQRGEDINQHLTSIEATLGKQMMLASMGLSSQDLQLVSHRAAEAIICCTRRMGKIVNLLRSQSSSSHRIEETDCRFR